MSGIFDHTHVGGREEDRNMEKVGHGFKLPFFFAGSIRVERPRSHPLCHPSPPKLHRNYSADGTLRVVVDSRGTLAVGRGTAVWGFAEGAPYTVSDH